MPASAERSEEHHEDVEPRGVDARDVAVVGGGIVGASLAVALARGGARVLLVEAREPGPAAGGAFDERPIALAAASVRILDTLGLWRAIAPAATPIARIHVSDRGHLGVARIDAGEMGVDALGQVVPASSIARACIDALAGESAIAVARPARVVRIERRAEAVRIALERRTAPQVVDARLVVAADGTDSAAARMLGASSRATDYHQSALSAVVSTTRDHRGTAYERFTVDGPLALLPMREGRCGLVWTVRSEQGEALAALDDRAFLERLEDAFGTRLGGFTGVGSRALHGLRAVRAREQVAERTALVGNAAHTLHPVAGQGLNLGMRDVAVLADHVARALREGHDPGAADLLEAYRAARWLDRDVVFRATDSLVRLFSNRVPGLGLARAAGLVAFDLAGPLKHAFARRAMGLAGAQSRLARGLSP